jgi:hypothetical protein
MSQSGSSGLKVKIKYIEHGNVGVHPEKSLIQFLEFETPPAYVS